MKNSILLEKSDQLAHNIYAVSKKFPREEAFGITSQIRRASLSVPLNIVEGYARHSDRSHKQFLLISYGSLKETKYLLNFIRKEQLITETEYLELLSLADEVGKILWTVISKIKEKTT